MIVSIGYAMFLDKVMLRGLPDKALLVWKMTEHVILNFEITNLKVRKWQVNHVGLPDKVLLRGLPDKVILTRVNLRYMVAILRNTPRLKGARFYVDFNF